jgi:hypothetical protein
VMGKQFAEVMEPVDVTRSSVWTEEERPTKEHE